MPSGPAKPHVSEGKMPGQRLSRAQVRSYLAHWRAARAAGLKELRAASPDHKLRQVAALMGSAKALGWSPEVPPEDASARERWHRLRHTVSQSDPLAPLLAALRDLMAWLQAADVRGLIVGGVAASVLGRARLTHDVDVLVMLDEAQWTAFLTAAAAFHFMGRVEDPVGFARRTRVLPVHHRPSAIDVDVIFGALPFEKEALARAWTVTAGGVSFPVATPEDLVVMKMVAHRPQDLLDVESILDARPRLGLRRVRRWLREFSVAMDMPEVLEDLEAALARRRRGRRPRGP